MRFRTAHDQERTVEVQTTEGGSTACLGFSAILLGGSLELEMRTPGDQSLCSPSNKTQNTSECTSRAKGVAFRLKSKTATVEFILDGFSSCRNGP